jgi:Na+/H+ antiporter NhaC
MYGGEYIYTKAQSEWRFTLLIVATVVMLALYAGCVGAWDQQDNKAALNGSIAIAFVYMFGVLAFATWARLGKSASKDPSGLQASLKKAILFNDDEPVATKQ